METDEIVKELRESLPPKIDYAELVGAEGFARGAYYVWEDPLPYLMSNAADLLESQQARITELKAQLAESQRRERAAVKDIMCRDHCDVCVSGKELDNECKIADYDCQTCKSATCRCRECRNEDKWQWRGPQEAGEGEAK